MSIFAPIRDRSRPRQRVTFMGGGTNVADTNGAAAAHFLNGLFSMQTQVDLAGMREARLVAVRRATAGAAGYTVELMYSAAVNLTPGNFLTLGKSAISANAETGSTSIDTGWFQILPAARTNVFVCPILTSGNGVADPNWGVIAAEFR